MLALLVVASACGAPRTSRPTSPDELPQTDDLAIAQVTRSPGRLGYAGSLTADGLEQLKRADDPSVRTLAIRSPGGDVAVGIAFGEWVHGRGLDVVVVDFCISSCANYVFTAARTKRVVPGAFVAWHGNSHQLDMRAQIADAAASPEEAERAFGFMRELRTKEAAYFAKIGVSECLCRIGTERLESPGLFTMSPADMQRFGVDNVLAAPEGRDDVPTETLDRFTLSFVRVPELWDARAACAAPD